jgi:hypothetical protein
MIFTEAWFIIVKNQKHLKCSTNKTGLNTLWWEKKTTAGHRRLGSPSGLFPCGMDVIAREHKEPALLHYCTRLESMWRETVQCGSTLQQNKVPTESLLLALRVREVLLQRSPYILKKSQMLTACLWGTSTRKATVLALYFSALFRPDLLGFYGQKANNQLFIDWHFYMAHTCKEVCRGLCRLFSTRMLLSYRELWITKLKIMALLN